MIKTHDLHDFMNQISDEIASEYARIQKRATEDPGTAGDQGEENWARILKDWLPQDFHVVTKGRIISQDGRTSPQIDVLVLHGSYPAKLLDKKLYLAAGVVAAFECKTTLKSSHIQEAIENCLKIKGLFKDRVGTPYLELHAPIVYGLLAHSHSWKSPGSTPEKNIETKLIGEDTNLITHPRQALDLLCVADLGAWNHIKMTFIGPNSIPSDWTNLIPIYGPKGSATTAYTGHTLNAQKQGSNFKPIGFLISQLTQKLAWEHMPLRALADYYRVTNLAGDGKGQMRKWSSAIYSQNVKMKVEKGHIKNGQSWDEWSVSF